MTTWEVILQDSPGTGGAIHLTHRGQHCNRSHRAPGPVPAGLGWPPLDDPAQPVADLTGSAGLAAVGRELPATASQHLQCLIDRRLQFPIEAVQFILGRVFHPHVGCHSVVL